MDKRSLRFIADHVMLPCLFTSTIIYVFRHTITDIGTLLGIIVAGVTALIGLIKYLRKRSRTVRFKDQLQYLLTLNLKTKIMLLIAIAIMSTIFGISAIYVPPISFDNNQIVDSPVSTSSPTPSSTPIPVQPTTPPPTPSPTPSPSPAPPTPLPTLPPYIRGFDNDDDTIPEIDPETMSIILRLSTRGQISSLLNEGLKIDGMFSSFTDQLDSSIGLMRLNSNTKRYSSLSDEKRRSYDIYTRNANGNVTGTGFVIGETNPIFNDMKRLLNEYNNYSIRSRVVEQVKVTATATFFDLMDEIITNREEARVIAIESNLLRPLTNSYEIRGRVHYITGSNQNAAHDLSNGILVAFDEIMMLPLNEKGEVSNPSQYATILESMAILYHHLSYTFKGDWHYRFETLLISAMLYEHCATIHVPLVEKGTRQYYAAMMYHKIVYLFGGSVQATPFINEAIRLYNAAISNGVERNASNAIKDVENYRNKGVMG